MKQSAKMAGCTGNAAVMKCTGEDVQLSDHGHLFLLFDVC